MVHRRKTRKRITKRRRRTNKNKGYYGGAAAAPGVLGLAPAPIQRHTGGILRPDEIIYILNIHRNRSFDILHRKVPQQHEHNCWADAATAIFFQSDVYNELMSDVLNNILVDITNNGGRINTSLYNDANIHRLANLINITYNLQLAQPPIILTYNIIRYIRKLFQLYEILVTLAEEPEDVDMDMCPIIREQVDVIQARPAARVASMNRQAANVVQVRMRRGAWGGLFTDLVGFPELLTSLNPRFRFLSMDNIEGVDEINRASIFGYYIMASPGARGHMVSLFKANGSWILFDNENIEGIYIFNNEHTRLLTENLITNVRMKYKALGMGPNEYDITLSNGQMLPIRFGYDMVLQNGVETRDFHLVNDLSYLFYAI
jgi:hypothetical protein